MGSVFGAAGNAPTGATVVSAVVTGALGAASGAVASATGGAVSGESRAGRSTVSCGEKRKRDGELLAFKGASVAACKLAEAAIKQAKRKVAASTLLQVSSSVCYGVVLVRSSSNSRHAARVGAPNAPLVEIAAVGNLPSAVVMTDLIWPLSV